MGLTTNLLRRYYGDTQGHFAVWFALISAPLLIMTSIVIDYQQSLAAEQAVQGALDTAVLASVADATLSYTEKEKIAKEVFADNYSGATPVALTATAGGNRVDMVAIGDFPTSLAKMAGISTIKISGTSAAETTTEKIICAMTLDPTGSETLAVSGNANFNSPECAVQVNSSAIDALMGQSNFPVTAADFCVHGGAIGNFKPYVNTQCSQVADPYAGKPAPTPGPCKSVPIPPKAKPPPGKFHKTAVVHDNVTITPGTYCNGITFVGSNITVEPGVYHIIDGPTTFLASSIVLAEDVTFILEGPGAFLTIEQGSDVTITASRTGEFAGLAFFQVPGTALIPGAMPENKSMLRSGGKLNVTGTLYFPTQSVEVSGQSAISANAKATSFISYQLKFSGKVQASLKVNHTLAGLPPLLPRSDEGVRLVK